jgi:hypothetical protein
MKFYGEAHLQQNYIKDAVILLDTAFPQSPKVGQIVFKDRILYICVEITGGLPVWVPLTNEITAYTHVQGTAAPVWNITHPLNTSHVSVTVYNTSNQVVIPNEITVNGPSSITIDFGTPAQGKAVVLSGHFDGQTKPTYAYEYYQTTPSDTWVISHSLGRYPIIRVFIGNQEVQPASITFDTLDQVTITFTSPQVGQAKLI